MEPVASPFEKAVQALHELGFTLYQARAYVTLTRTGVTRVQPLSNASGVPRNKLYDVLESLERDGLVHVSMRKPLTVEARPFRPVLERRVDDATRLLGDVAGQGEPRREAAPAVPASRPWWVTRT